MHQIYSQMKIQQISALGTFESCDFSSGRQFQLCVVINLARATRDKEAICAPASSAMQFFRPQGASRANAGAPSVVMAPPERARAQKQPLDFQFTWLALGLRVAW